MVTDVIIKYLDNESNSIGEKVELVRRCELSYSDIFYLMEKYKDTDLYPGLHSLVYFDDAKLHEKLKKERQKNKMKNQSKRLRHIKKRGL